MSWQPDGQTSSNLLQAADESLKENDEAADIFLWMQGRMVELLLRHDVQRFDRIFGERRSEPDWLADERLARYRELAVVFYLRSELFEHILPRIKSRLSFDAPRETRIEELPSRGRIDWHRTAAANWNDLPGEVPLEVHTRQRRRQFARPENLLTVVTILEYRQAALYLLEMESVRNNIQALSHPLNEIVDLCNRELAFLQFAGLRSQSEDIISGYSSQTPEELEQRVAYNLLPGSNSAYADLLEWRHKFTSLGLLERTAKPDEYSKLGADPDRDNYLYQLWLFYELGELLDNQEKLLEWDRRQMRLTYKWGEGTQERKYRLQHDQNIKGTPRYWKDAPGVRPDLYIERVDPPAQPSPKLSQETWHEPGFMLDAKYYKPRANPKAPGEPVKRMLADLTLTGTQYGALLFAFLGPQGKDDEVEPGPEYLVESLLSDPRATRLLTIEVHKICPSPDSINKEEVGKKLLALLEKVHQKLAPAPALACHGIYLDAATSNQDGIGRLEPLLLGLPQQNILSNKESRWLVCPKPHLGPGRADIVDYEVDCLKNPYVCHVIGLKNVRPPFQIPRKIDDLPNALKQLKAKTISEDSDHETIKRIQQEFIDFTRRYADLTGADLDYYRRQFRDEHLIDYWDHNLLTQEHKEALALGKFLQDQISKVGGSDYSGPGLHYGFVFEALISATIFAGCHGLTGYWKDKKGQTLGTLPGIYKFRNSPEPSHRADRNDWPIIQGRVRTWWNSQVSSEPPIVVSFEDFVIQIEPVKEYRNKAAHPGPLGQKELQKLWQLLFVKTNTFSIGLIPSLLSAWKYTA